MTALPTKGSLDGSQVGFNQGVFKTSIGKMRDFIADLFGTDTASFVTTHSAFKLNEPGVLRNFSLAGTLAASAMTVSLLDASGVDPTPYSPVLIGQRSNNPAVGQAMLRSVESALSLSLMSGATLGQPVNSAQYLYLYAIDNGGAQELAVSGTYYGQSGIVTTVAMSAVALSAAPMYSTAARAGVAFRALARMRAPQPTPGTWTAAPTRVDLWPWDDAVNVLQPGQCIMSFDQLADGGIGRVVLKPYNGNKLTVNGQVCVIPDAGLSLAPTGLLVSTVYYIYATAVGGIVNALVASATGHSASTTEGNKGVEIMTGDDTKTLVGMTYTSTAARWMYDPNRRHIRTWFNDTGIGGYAGISIGLGIPANAASMDISDGQGAQPGFLTWGNSEIIVGNGNFNVWNTNNSSSVIQVWFGIDAQFLGQSEIATTWVNGTHKSALSSGGCTYPINEGFHRIHVFVSTNCADANTQLAGTVAYTTRRN